MRNVQDIDRNRRALRMLILLTVLSSMPGMTGCSGTPKLTAEDRRSDIEFMARWARDYSPLVELNEKHKGTPGYEALLEDEWIKWVISAPSPGTKADPD